MSKNPKPIIKEKNAIKKQRSPKTHASEGKRSGLEVSPWLEDYLDCFQLKYKPVTEAFITRISQEMITWAKTDEKAYKISQFFTPKHIGYDTYMGWVKRHEEFAHAYNLAKIIIGDRRESGALERKFDATTVAQMMPFYDNDWKLISEWRNKLRTEVKAAENSGTKIVVLDRFASSDIVPERPKKEAPVRTPEEVAAEVSMKKDVDVD